MKRKVPSPPPPPLPPAKPRRAGAPRTTRLAGDANFSGREGGGGGDGTNELSSSSSRRRNPHRRKDSIPIPPPTHKYTTRNPSTKSPVYHLVYDLTSPPSPNYNHTVTGHPSSSNNNSSNSGIGGDSVATSASAIFGNTTWSSHYQSQGVSISMSGPGSEQNIVPSSLTSRSTSTFTCTRLPVYGGQDQVYYPVVGGREGGGGGQPNGLQVRPGILKKRGGAKGERGRDESDTANIGREKPTSVSSPPAPAQVHSSGRGTRTREQNGQQTISAVPVNWDSDQPPPLPPPRVPTIINVNGDVEAADGIKWDTVTNNTGLVLHPRLLPSTSLHHHRQSQFRESGHDGDEGNALRLSYRKKFASARSSSSSKTGGDQNASISGDKHHARPVLNNSSSADINLDLDKLWSERQPGDCDRQQTLHQTLGEGDTVWTGGGSRAEFSSVEIPSFLPADLASPRQGVGHEQLQTADTTGISSSVHGAPTLPSPVTASARSSANVQLVSVSGVFPTDPVNNKCRSRPLDAQSQVCFIGREAEGGGCQVSFETPNVDLNLDLSVRGQSLLSSSKSKPSVLVDTSQCRQNPGVNSEPGSGITSSKSLVYSGKDINRVRFACDSYTDKSKSSFDESRISQISEGDVFEPSRISVRDAVTLWDKPNKLRINSEKSVVSSGTKTKSVVDVECNSGVDSEPDHHLKKAVIHRHGDSLRFFINHNDSGVVSDNEQSDGNNPPVSLESYVDPITGKPIDWIISTDSKNPGKSKHGSKNDKHAGIISKVLDLTLSRASGNWNNKTTSLSLLSSFSSSKSSKPVHTQQQAVRPRPPVNRWDNIHVRPPQTHPLPRSDQQGHVSQTFQTLQDNTAPALPPRQPSSSSLPQQQHPEQAPGPVNVLCSTLATSPQAAEGGGGGSFVSPNKAPLTFPDQADPEGSLGKNVAFSQALVKQHEPRHFSCDTFYGDFNSNSFVDKVCFPLSEHSSGPSERDLSHTQLFNHSHDGVLHLEQVISRDGGIVNSSSYSSGFNPASVTSTSQSTCNAVSGLNAVPYHKGDQSRTFPQSISFDTPIGQELRNPHQSVSSHLSCPQPDPLPGPRDQKSRAGHKEVHNIELLDVAENNESVNTRSDLAISSVPLPGGYRLDQRKNCVDLDLVVGGNDPPPPPLPARGLSQHRDLSSSSLFAHNHEITRDLHTSQVSPAVREHTHHTHGDSPLSDFSKHRARHGELISFDHKHKVQHSWDLPELTNGVNPSLDRETVLFNSPVSIRTANSLVDRPVAPPPIEDRFTYQRSLQEECQKNQLWNLYGFHLKETHRIKDRLSSNHNNPIGLQQLGLAEPIPVCANATSVSGAAEEGDLHGQDQQRQPAKITPRQKFEILHSRVSEKVATNLRRPVKSPAELVLSVLQGNSNCDADFDTGKDRNNLEAISPSSTESRDFKHIAALNLVQSPIGYAYKESPRARFEKDRAARIITNTVDRPGDLYTDSQLSGVTHTSLRLNRSCEELETETFGSRPGSETSFLTTKASLPRSFSPTQDLDGQCVENWAPPLPPKPSLCHRLPSGHLQSSDPGTIAGWSYNARDNKQDRPYESESVNHSLLHNSDPSKTFFVDSLTGDQVYSVSTHRVGEASVWSQRRRSGQTISCGARTPLVELTNNCSEKSVPVSSSHDSWTGDTARRVAFSVPPVPDRADWSVQHVRSPGQAERAGSGHRQWSGPVTSQADRDNTGSETGSLLGQQSATRPLDLVLAQEKGEYNKQDLHLASTEIQASDNRGSAGDQQALDSCKDSSHFLESSNASSACVSQSKRLLTVREDITTNLDPATQGHQSCALTQVGSVSDPGPSCPSFSSGPRKGLAVKKMSPGSVTSSGYESEINSAIHKLNGITVTRNNTKNISNSNNELLRDANGLSTVQQLRLRFGHNPGSTSSGEQFSFSKNNNNNNRRKHSANTDSSNENDKLDNLFYTQHQNQSESEHTDRCGSRSFGDQKVQTQSQRHRADWPSRHRSTSPRYSSSSVEQPHNKKLLKQVSRSMHGIIHDLKLDNRRSSPSKHSRSCQHKPHKRKLSRGSPSSKPAAGAGRTGSRSASASSECTICGEESKNNSCDITDNKPDPNNNFKTTLTCNETGVNQTNQVGTSLSSLNTGSTDIDTYNIYISKNNRRHSDISRVQQFPNDKAVMLAAKGLRIYESGEEYIAMRSPVKSPLLKSLSAPQFGWEGAHYLIVPTVVEPFSPDITSSAGQAMSPTSTRSRSVSEENKDYSSNTLLTHRSISDSGTSRRISASRFDDGIDASDFFSGHRSDGDDYDDETNGFDDVNYKGGSGPSHTDDVYLPMRERKLSARHRAMSVDVLYKERPEKIQSDGEPLSPERRHMMRRYFQPHVDSERGRGYVEWKTCSGWVGKVDMRNAPNGRNSRGYVEWDTIWTAAAPWGAREDDEHVYDVIAENSSTCSTEEAVPKMATDGGEVETSVKRERHSRGSITSVALDTPPALPERTYINKIKNTRSSDSIDNASSSSASSTAGHKHHHHHPHCKKHHRHHHHQHHHHNHHHHAHSHNHHPHHNHHHQHHHDPQQQQPPQHQSPPQRPLKPSNLNICSTDQQQQQQQQHQSPTTSSPLSTPTKSKVPYLNKPPPKPPRQQLQTVQSSIPPHQHLHQQQQQQQHPSDPLPLSSSAKLDVTTVSENYSEVNKLKGYKFTNLLTAVESDSPIPHLRPNHTSDPNAIYSETYWHLGPAVAPQARATVWQSGDVLDYIDGLHDSMSPKRRENIYILLNNKKTRAKFSESLEIESRLLSKGLLSPSPSSTASASSSSPLPPSSVAPSISSPFPSFVMSRFPECNATTEVKTSSTSVNKPESGPGSMAGSALTTPTVITTHPARVIKRKGATAPVSSTYV